MRKLNVFNNISLDGYFTDQNQDMSWAHNQDREWTEFASENARGEGVLLFGRVTYDMMRSFWPTPQARSSAPVIAERMNSGAKVVFSRTLKEATWQNTQLLKGDLVSEVQQLKASAGPDLVLMGSGSIVAQLAEARLIDAYQLVIHPLAIGNGRTLFEGVTHKVELELERTRTFKNGNVVIWYSARA
jgi:dihydrofolate reductase